MFQKKKKTNKQTNNIDSGKVFKTWFLVLYYTR